MKRFLEQPNNKTYDLIVIGGGITGAAVAYEAASRGFSVALVDKGDFGAATSSATSKLIHGGLRYLANLEYGLVRESLHERKNLENIAPNLVYPIPFLIPTYHGDLQGKWLLEIGMILYDLLSYDKGFTWDSSKKLPLHQLLSSQKVRALEPLVRPGGLTGGIVFYDCTSLMPERLTLAFVRSAVKYGADAANYAKVEGFIRDGERVQGVVVRDLIHAKTVELRGKLTINCGGPWADLLLDKARGAHAAQSAQHIKRSEGIHILTRKLTNSHCVSGRTANGKAFNIIPWRGHSLIGTTDREYTGDPDNYQVTRQKIEEYVDQLNSALSPEDQLQYADVLYAYGGLRPLIDDQNKEVIRTSRKYEIYDNAPDGLEGLITVEGGKYTTSRNLAENVLKMVLKKSGSPYKKSITAKNFLAGCEIPDISAFVAQAKADYSDFAPASVDYLARIYGTELSQVMEIARSDRQYAAPLNQDGEMTAQVVYAIRQEMAQTLMDILIRRTGIGTLGHPGDSVLEAVAKTAAQELNWDQARLAQELQQANRALSLP